MVRRQPPARCEGNKEKKQEITAFVSPPTPERSKPPAGRRACPQSCIMLHVHLSRARALPFFSGGPLYPENPRSHSSRPLLIFHAGGIFIFAQVAP